MSPSRLLPVGIGLVSMLAGFALYHLLRPGPPEPPPAAAADIELHSIPLTDLDGRQSLIGDWRDKILVVNLWAPWCAPCRREVPTLVELQQTYAERGLVVIGIAFDGEEPVRRFAEEHAINYPLFLAGNRSPMYNAALGNPSGALPFTAMLDRGQQIRFRHSGEITADLLQTWLEALR